MCLRRAFFERWRLCPPQQLQSYNLRAMPFTPTFSRVFWIVLDSVGIGEMPDAAAYGDVGSDTLGNMARQRRLKLPNLCRWGLANIKPLTGLSPVAEPVAAF